MTAIADLVDTTLNALDDMVLPSANWVLELLEAKEALGVVTDTTLTAEDIRSRGGSRNFCLLGLNVCT